MDYTIKIRDGQTLPDGYRWGAYLSEPGVSGYYVIRESDGESCIARVEPDSLIDDRTAEDIDDAIREACGAEELEELEVLEGRYREPEAD